MQPIRILQVFTVLNRGGAETMIMNYYRHIDRSKVQFDFLVHRSQPGAYEEEIKKLGGRIYRMPPLYPKYFNSYIKQIKAFLKEHTEYQVIHCHCSELGYFLYREAYKQKVPVIICHAHSSRMLMDLKAPIRWYWKHGCRKYITHPFTCSKKAASWMYGHKMMDKAIQINNAIDTKAFTYEAKTAERLRKQLGLKDKMVLGHVGTFNEPKNHKFLISTFASVKKELPNAMLMLVGQGDLEEKIRSEVQRLGLEKDVMFMGCRSDVNELLKVFDLFVFPSLFEGLPVTVIEAQASGLHCLISDQITTEVDMGVQLVDYLPITNEKVWIECIKTLAKEVEKLRSSRKSHISEIRAKGYDIHREAKKIETFYINCLEGEQSQDEAITNGIYANL